MKDFCLTITSNKIRLKKLFLFSFFYVLLFNLWLYRLYEINGIGSVAVGLLSSVLMCFGIFLLLSTINRIFFFISLWGLSTLMAFMAWFLHYSGLTFNQEILGSILEAKPQEILIYLNVSSVSLFLIIGLFSWFSSKWIEKRSFPKIKEKIHLSIFSVFIVVLLNVIWLRQTPYNVWLPPVTSSDLFSSASKFPVYQSKNIIWELHEYYTETKRFIESFQNLKDPAKEESSCTETNQVTIIVHVGEALRADRLSINGFERNTTPRLLKEKNLISFPKVLSHGTNTRVSTWGLLTDATVEGRIMNYSSFISLFNKHGYTSHAIILPGGSIHDMPAQKLLESVKHKIETDGDALYDIMLTLPHIFKAISAPAAKKIVYINNMGNHPSYYYRKENRIFTPDQFNFMFPTMHPPQNAANAYDNATRQNDDFWGEVFEVLKDKNAIYFYCSDHGQSLGENGYFTQGASMNVPEQRYVACFVWWSEQFEKTHPFMISNLKNNARRLPVISHDHFYHTVISLGSIKSKIQRPELDLTSPHALPWNGSIPPWPKYDQQLEKHRKENNPAQID